MKMNEHVKAACEVAGCAFAMGMASALAPYIQSHTLPSQSQWSTMIMMTLFASVLLAWQRYAPAPWQQKIQEIAGQILSTTTSASETVTSHADSPTTQVIKAALVQTTETTKKEDAQ